MATVFQASVSPTEQFQRNQSTDLNPESSRAASTHHGEDFDELEEEETPIPNNQFVNIQCQWDNGCNLVFYEMETITDHIHNGQYRSQSLEFEIS